MLKQLCGLVAVLALSACANSERLMDANVRPSDHADCLVGTERGEPLAKGVSPAMRSRRCNPDDLNWSSDQSRKDAMEVDFKKMHD